MDNYGKCADLLLKSQHAMALTGAGISVESGIPDFRSKGGLWSVYDPAEYASIGSFRRNPAKVWKMLREMDDLLGAARPNAAHVALAELEKLGILKEVVTQNIDSLHQRAGSLNVIEFHGHNRSLRCDVCGAAYTRESVSLDTLPPRCGCGEALRPEIVFFGEEIPHEAYRSAMVAAQRCDVMLIVGTSATVAPASYLPQIAKRQGAFILEINPTVTELSGRLTDLHINEPAGKAMSGIMAALNHQEVLIEGI